MLLACKEYCPIGHEGSSNRAVTAVTPADYIDA